MKAAVVLLAILSSALCGPSDDPRGEIRCPLSIEVAQEHYTSSFRIRPTLISRSVRVVYLPLTKPFGFRVERLEGAEWIAPPADRQAATTLPDLREYRLDEPDLLPISWKDIASSGRGGRYTVPAGTYRFLLHYYLKPLDKMATTVSLEAFCVVRSRPFSIENESTWQKFD